MFHRLSNQCNFTALRSLTKLYDSRTRKRLPAVDGTSVPPLSNGMLLQPDTHPITEEQLVNEVRCQHCLKKISRTLCDAGKNVALWNPFIFRAIETQTTGIAGTYATAFTESAQILSYASHLAF